MLMDTIFVVLGLALLFFGGEGLIRGAVSLAGRLGVSTLLIGVVIVGFGTSAPELLVSLQAAFRGTSDIALGNVVGSNIANILLILGLAALIAPVECPGGDIRRDALAGVGAALLLGLLSLTHELRWPEGLPMVAALVGYVWYCYRAERRKKVAAVAEEAEHREHMQEDLAASDGVLRALLYVAGGLLLLLAGAHFLVEGSVAIARGLGISEAVIGLTLVAVGTSLPELAAAVAAARKGHGDVVIGNVMGSNLFNILLILGLTAIFAPIPFAGRIADIDVWIMLAVAAMLYAIIRSTGRVGRPAGAAFIAVYVAYSVWLYVG